MGVVITSSMVVSEQFRDSFVAARSRKFLFQFGPASFNDLGRRKIILLRSEPQRHCLEQKYQHFESKKYWIQLQLLRLQELHYPLALEF